MVDADTAAAVMVAGAKPLPHLLEIETRMERLVVEWFRRQGVSLGQDGCWMMECSSPTSVDAWGADPRHEASAEAEVNLSELARFLVDELDL